MKPVPLRPDYSAVRARPGQSLIRSAAALLSAHVEHKFLDDVMRSCWPHDKNLPTIVKATTQVASEANTAQLIGMEVGNVVDLLGGASTSGRLFELGTSFHFGGTGQIQVQAIVADPTAVAFIAPGSPIPVRQFSTTPMVILKPFKISSIVVFTNETLRSSALNVETIVRQKLSADLDLGIDKLLLDATAASTVRPAGLRNGIAALTASAATSPLEAMMEDVAAVTGAVASVARNAPIALVASPAQANSIALWSKPNFPYQVLATSGLPDKTLLALASNCLVSAVDVPRFAITDQAVLHMEDTTPLDITTAAVATSVKSLFQSDETGLRVTADVAWGLRSTSGVAWIANTNW